ncbi:MAG: CapA family protein, partial [Calditrichae bacterium]|nr:CapA family protein [Calditrichia bacterium]
TADIIFTNLEAPFCNQPELKAFNKKYTFQVNPELVNVLKTGNINLVSLANNHIMDYGIDCLKETFQVLDEHQIQYAGAGLHLNEARKATIFNIKGKRIGFLAYSLTFPEEFWATDTSAGTCFPYEEFVFSDIRELNRTCDYVIISCHWGEELRETPKEYQVKLAHQFIDVGADLILGHHPHIVQGIELYKDKLIAYSLGNFIFGSYSENAKVSLLLKVTLNSNEFMNVQILPISVYNKEVEFQPVPLNEEQKGRFFEHLTQLSLELNIFPLGITNEGILKVINKS